MTDYEDDQLKEENARKQRDMAQREIDDIRFVMSSEQGQRNLALELFQRVMAHCPEQYLKMAKEASEQE
ncbi:TPA: hypothetical protein ACGKX5_002950 [Escherichia coli]